ncbi:hypothetical protein [Halovenus marina]|uniref:hypothetical protein n=1 Tax=Halovenus marina TaxID=3396621 RepID=UPI003F54D2D4
MREDQITNKFIHSLDGSISERAVDSRYSVYGDKFFDGSTNSPETITGSDFIIATGVVSTEGYWGSGIIAQAKSAPKHDTPPVEELQKDCEKMLSYTPSSFAVMYHESGFRFYPARALMPLNPARFSGRGADRLHTQINWRDASAVLYSLPTGFVGDNWVFENLESILRPLENPISHRGVAMDGGSQREDLDESGIPAALLLLFVDPEYEAQYIDERLPYDDLPFSPDGPFSGISEL